ncbi:TATA element modulatory factor isoform X2 [Thrips palmi]|uniref:TATA element modulatory factor isoform X2 n=1 Tax=Thrips palmi TaxID=161013 RepID=A0A6P9A2G3_THRPL|nr:TATA element modulatory factor isoform X2 [Thrips palmi]
MNWFGATELVTAAKSAVKGAQKAIDKALDIKEEVDSVDKIEVPALGKDDSDSFFSNWGVKADSSPDKNPAFSVPQETVSSSLWGSFTGSFFENPRPLPSPGDEGSSSPISQQPKRSAVSRLLAAHIDTDVDTELALEDDGTVRDVFSKTQLVVESSTPNDDKCGNTTSIPLSDEVERRRKDKHCERSQNRNSFSNNRLSVISSESDRRSSDSVEILGSTSCTASPDSDLPTSLSASSLASSVGFRPVSIGSPDSVEVIAESSESYSASVEVLGSHSSSTSLCSPLEPPLDRPCPSSDNLASPDSVEIVPEEDDDVSFADDSYASASASESTMTQATILEPHGLLCSTMESSTSYVEPIDSAGHSDFNTSSISGQTDSSVSSLLDSSTDTIRSEYPQTSKSSWASTSQQSSERLSPAFKSHESSLENISMKLPASPKKTSTKPKDSPPRAVEKEPKQSSLDVGSDLHVDGGGSGLTLTDSSGEGTLVGSSSDDTIPGSDSQSQQSTSGYVRNLLADAMVDDSAQIRVNSPVSVESRSDGLRLGSEQTSGHTSGDELETTTSSDIEIISSPNGDGSSTASRQSPAKHLQRVSQGPVDMLKFSGKIKAHFRDLEFGVILLWLFIFLLRLSYCDACSSRTPPRRPPSTPRPNITEHDALYSCPSQLAEVFCLNGAECVEIRFSHDRKVYSCSCADGFWGTRCHQREPSEASSGGSDDSHSSEMDRLLKRLSEMTELLEARETKLLVLSRSHAELQESYQEMRSQLENAQQSRLVESRSLNEEFTRRLSALERKFQQAIRDKDILQRQLEQSKSELAHELTEHVGERDETIKELREEGEKLSRQQLQQSNLIKKLRAKEKENDSTIKSLREQVDNLTGEIERLKRSLAAKEDVERSQIEAVHQLTARVKKQDAEILAMKEVRDHFQKLAESTQGTLDSTQKELDDARAREEGADQRVKEARENVEESARAELEAALSAAQQHKRQIMAQMDTMREQLAQVESQQSRREGELLQRLESAERRSEELSQQLSEATRPLLRQLQTFQASSKTQQDAWERQERSLSDALAEAQSQLEQVTEAERGAREELLTLRSKVSKLENKLSASLQTSQAMQDRSSQLQSELDRATKLSEESRNVLESQVNDLKRQLSSVDHQLSVERAAVEAEKRRCIQLQEQLTDRERTLDQDKERDTDLGKRESPLVVASGHSSPTISFGRESISESVSSVAWPVFSDEGFETTSMSGRNVYESVRLNHTTSVLEGLQSQLKLREGEVQQLQWELSRREAQRCALTAELSTLSVRAEEQETRLNSSIHLQEELSSQLSSLRTEYDALLQLYGEKLEETQELRLDLQDVKDMYKAQIDQLLKKEELGQISRKKETTCVEPKDM